MTIRVKFTHYAGLNEQDDPYKNFIKKIMKSGGEDLFLSSERTFFESALLNKRKVFVPCRTLELCGGDTENVISFLQKSFSDGLKEEAPTVEFVTDENKVVHQVPVRNFSANMKQRSVAETRALHAQ